VFVSELPRRATLKYWLLNACGLAFLLVAGFLSYLASTRQGQDFGVLYAAAVGILSGEPMYSAEWQKNSFAAWSLPHAKNLPYPPSAGFVMLPLALFPFAIAQMLFLLAMVCAVAWGTKSLAQILAPKAQASVWLFAAAVVLLSACVRWGMTPLQSAPFVLGLFAALIAALHTNRSHIAFLIVACVTALKFTVAFPFVALLVLYRRFVAVIGVGVLLFVLNILGFMRVGGWTAVDQFRMGIQGHELNGTVDSPDPWDLQSVPRLDWAYLLNGFFGQQDIFRIVAIIAFLLICMWLFWRSVQLSRPVGLDAAAALSIGLICAGLQVVYHHHYDLSILVAPFAVVFALTYKHNKFRNKLAWLLAAPLLLMLAFLPIARGKAIAVALFGEPGHGIFNLAFPIATTLTLASSLLFLRDIVRDKKTSRNHIDRGQRD
jgi:hypothetical protein